MFWGGLGCFHGPFSVYAADLGVMTVYARLIIQAQLHYDMSGACNIDSHSNDSQTSVSWSENLIFSCPCV